MSETPISGSCLCGTVTFAVSPPFMKMVHCHCERCRKSSGTGHATNIIASVDGFRWLTGEEAIRRYDLPDAKSFSKWFCSDCGCPVPRKSRAGNWLVIPAGSLDSEPEMAPTDRIFWASRAAWSCDAGGLPTHDEYPDSW